MTTPSALQSFGHVSTMSFRMQNNFVKKDPQREAVPGLFTHLCFASSESYEEIQSTLTEMESCMRLLSSEYDLPHTQTPSSSSSTSSQPAAEKHQFTEEQPCCSKDLEEPRGDAKTAGGEKTGNWSEQEEGRRSSRGDMKGKDEGGASAAEDEKKNQTESCRKGGEEEQDKESEIRERDEEEEEGSEEEDKAGKEEAEGSDAFIRSSGLITHSYNLDLELNPGQW